MSETTTNPQPISLGELIDLLDARPHDQDVSFDFASLTPTTVDSYRGYYDHLALGYADNGRCTVGELLAKLRAAIGTTYTGYKGGEYTMTRETPMWVANYGQSGSTAILGLRDELFWTYIATGFCTDWHGGYERAFRMLARAGAPPRTSP